MGRGNQLWQKYIKTNRQRIRISVFNEPVLFKQFYSNSSIFMLALE